METQHHALTGRDIVRAILPPWDMESPVVRYETRRRKRLGRNRTPGFIFLSLFVVLGPLCALSSLTDMLTYGAVLLLAYIYLTRYRLIFGILGRTTTTIAERRQRGEWELILLTPMPKREWLRWQIVAVGWQVWPLVRGLLIAHGLLALLIFGLTLQEHIQQGEYQPFSVYGEINTERDYLPTWFFGLTILPFVVAFALLPLVETAALIAIGLHRSSRAQQAGVSFTQGLLSVLSARFQGSVVFTLVVVVCLFPVLFLSLFTREPVASLLSLMFIVVAYMVFSIPAGVMLALFWEWLPLFPLSFLMTATYEGSAELITLVIGVLIYSAGFVVAFWVVPSYFMRNLTGKSVRELYRREV